MQYTAVAITGTLLLSGGAVAQEGSPSIAAGQSPSLSESVPMPDLETGVSGYQVVAIAAGAVAGVVAANLMTGGMISSILLYGSGAVAPSAAVSPGVVATMVAVEVIWTAVDVLIVAAAPTAAASVAGPVHAALGDGYTTPETLLLAVGESIEAAKTAAGEVEAYVSTAVEEWWSGK
jgi:hypothetical protein